MELSLRKKELIGDLDHIDNIATKAETELNIDMLDWDYKLYKSYFNEVKFCTSEVALDKIEKKIRVLAEAMELKAGRYREIVRLFPELEEFDKKLDSIDFTKDISSIEKITNIFKDELNGYFAKKTDYSTLKNKHLRESTGAFGLAIESLKSILENKEYLREFDDISPLDILCDYIKLSKFREYDDSMTNISLLRKMEVKYIPHIMSIWKKEIMLDHDEEGNFRLLAEMITNPSDIERVSHLIRRPDQHSCSYITNKYNRTYARGNTRVGFLYSSDVNILNISCYDMNSNLHGLGASAFWKYTKLATPKAVEKIGVKITSDAPEKNNNYNEVLISADTKPAAVVLLIDNDEQYQSDLPIAKHLSDNYSLPLVQIDLRNRNKENDNENREGIER